MPSQEVKARLLSEFAKRAGALSAAEESALADVSADATATRYRAADVDALIAAVADLQTAYDGASALGDISDQMDAATAAAGDVTANASAGGV